jgi:hypothetical protein
MVFGAGEHLGTQFQCHLHSQSVHIFFTMPLT